MSVRNKGYAKKQKDRLKRIALIVISLLCRIVVMLSLHYIDNVYKASQPE